MIDGPLGFHKVCDLMVNNAAAYVRDSSHILPDGSKAKYAIDFVTDKEFKHSCSGRVFTKPDASLAGAQSPMAIIEPLPAPAKFFGKTKIVPPEGGYTGVQYGTLLFGCFSDADRSHGAHAFPRSPAEIAVIGTDKVGLLSGLEAVNPLNRYEHLYLKLEGEGMECEMVSHSQDFINGHIGENSLQLTAARKEGGKSKNWFDMPNAVSETAPFASTQTRRRQPLNPPHRSVLASPPPPPPRRCATSPRCP